MNRTKEVLLRIVSKRQKTPELDLRLQSAFEKYKDSIDSITECMDDPELGYLLYQVWDLIGKKEILFPQQKCFLRKEMFKRERRSFHIEKIYPIPDRFRKDEYTLEGGYVRMETVLGTLEIRFIDVQQAMVFISGGVEAEKLFNLRFQREGIIHPLQVKEKLREFIECLS